MASMRLRDLGSGKISSLCNALVKCGAWNFIIEIMMMNVFIPITFVNNMKKPSPTVALLLNLISGFLKVSINQPKIVEKYLQATLSRYSVSFFIIASERCYDCYLEAYLPKLRQKTYIRNWKKADSAILSSYALRQIFSIEIEIY